jgi:hypothetical protein
MTDFVAGRLFGRKNLFQRARFAEHLKHALLHDGRNQKDEIMVLGWRVYPPSFQQSITSGTHSESSLEQVGQS